jgi:hypothetical protein
MDPLIFGKQFHANGHICNIYRRLFDSLKYLLKESKVKENAHLKLRIVRCTEKGNELPSFDHMVYCVSFVHSFHVWPLIPGIWALMRPYY